MGVERAIEIHPFQVGVPEDELAGCNAGSRRRAGLLKSSCKPLPGCAAGDAAGTRPLLDERVRLAQV